MKQAAICFARVPKPGVTKTRLLPILSGDQCARLRTGHPAQAIYEECLQMVQHYFN